MDGCESVTNDDREEFSGEKGYFFCLVFRAASTVCWSFRANEALMRSLGASVPVCLISHHVLNSTITKKRECRVGGMNERD